MHINSTYAIISIQTFDEQTFKLVRSKHIYLQRDYL